MNNHSKTNMVTVKDIVNRHYNKLTQYQRKIVRHFEPEVIHQFRVAYKKLRAFFRMASGGNVIQQKIKFSRKLKACYRIAGAVRDLQLQQQRIAESAKRHSEQSLGYAGSLQKEITGLKRDLLELLLKNPVCKSKKKTKALLPEAFPLTNFKSFIQKKWATCNNIIKSGDFSNTNIHAIRKNLKDSFYNLEIYRAIRQPILVQPAWKKKERSEVEDLLQELGKFQDKCAAIALLKPARLKGLHTDSKHRLEQIKKLWTSEKVILKQSLVKKLKAAVIVHPGKLNLL